MTSASSTTPRESSEWRPFTVTVNGAPVVTGVETCVTIDPARPTNWVPATVRDLKTLIRISGLAKGSYRAWARVTHSDETAVIDLGYFSIS